MKLRKCTRTVGSEKCRTLTDRSYLHLLCGS